ncbi:MAG TPA: prephenate dehydratase domain-containing protein [Bacteroidia bacterium]|nr:prephenate dehydratase domain-containing protein [Bacteroidia bacterium]
MRPLRISIPARENSFHHHAARRYFGEDAVMLHTGDMRSAIARAEENLSDYTLLACSNTVAGHFYETYRLIYESKLHILDEVEWPVSLCLAAKPGVSLAEIRTAASHPYALMQAEKTLLRKKITGRKNTADTVEAARIVSRNSAGTLACVCAADVAERSGLQILLENVQEHRNNRTRFFIAGKGEGLHDHPDKLIVAADAERLERPFHNAISVHRVFPAKQKDIPVFAELVREDGWKMIPGGLHVLGKICSAGKRTNHKPIHISL